MSSNTHTVTVNVGSRTVPLERLVQRYENGESLQKEEINVLAEYPHTGVDVAEWRRLKAKRMFGSVPHRESDAAAEQAAVGRLRDILQEHDVNTVEEYYELLVAVGDDHPVQDVVERLTSVVTPFEESREPSLLDHLEAFENQSAAELYRPPDAGGDWDPAKDQGLHEFIAMMEDGVGEDDPLQAVFQGDTWTELKEQAKFDPEEWGFEEEGGRAVTEW